MRKETEILDEIKDKVFPKIDGWKAQLTKELEDALKPNQNLVEAFIAREAIFLDKSHNIQFKPKSQEELDKALAEIDKGSNQYFLQEERLIKGLVEYGLKEEELRALKKSDLLRLNSIEFLIVGNLVGTQTRQPFAEALSSHPKLESDINSLMAQAEEFIAPIVRKIFQKHIYSLLHGQLPIGMHISQQLNGVPKRQSKETAANPLDHGHSHIYGTSVYKQFHNGEETTTFKPSDDKIIIGYTNEGLPFQIVVDGFLGANTLATFRFIDKCISPLMNDFAKDLSDSLNPEETIQNFIKNIYTLRNKYPGNPEFTMSIAITYKKMISYIVQALESVIRVCYYEKRMEILNN